MGLCGHQLGESGGNSIVPSSSEKILYPGVFETGDFFHL